MGEELIRMESICKHFPGVKALDNVSLTVHAGEVHALLGENGAGKSTLIKILNGVHTPTAGEIYVKGKKVDIHNVSEAQKLNIGIIFQEFNLCPDLSVAENIYIGRQKKNRFGLISPRQVNRDAQDLLNELGLKQIKATDIVRTLSTSQMQMVEIAKAMSFDSDVIVFDEPTASLTEAEIKVLFGIIRDLCGRGKGIIYISHRMEELKEIANTVTILRDGQKIGESFAFQEKTLDEIIRMMVGRELKDKYPTGCHLIVCRNVMIYFTEEAKLDIYKNFNRALVNDGCLFVGNTEQIINHKDLGYTFDKLFFYRKVQGI